MHSGSSTTQYPRRTVGSEWGPVSTNYFIVQTPKRVLYRGVSWGLLRGILGA